MHHPISVRLPDAVGRLAAGMAGVCWIATTVVPWNGGGSLSSSTVLDLARLISEGIIHVSPVIRVPIFALPLAGVALLASTPLVMLLARLLRISLAILGLAAAAILLATLPHASVGYGTGGRLAIWGMALSALALLSDLTCLWLVHTERTSP